jgi:hypothetical protein
MVGIVHVLRMSSARHHMTFVILERRGSAECYYVLFSRIASSTTDSRLVHGAERQESG